MADLQKTSRIFGQVEYTKGGLQKTSRVFGQVEYEPTSQLKVMQVIGQVEYVDTSEHTTTTTTTHFWEEDFEAITTGGPPAEWSELWNTANVDPSVEAGGAGRILQVDIDANIKAAVAWDRVVDRDTMEVLALVQVTDGFATMAGGVGVRLTGTVGTETGYLLFLDPANDEIVLRRYNGGLSTTLATFAHTLTTSRWYWIRLQAQGSVIKARVWNRYETEPGTWGVDHTDSSPVSGAGDVGVITYNADVNCDHFLADSSPASWPIPQPLGYNTTTSTTTHTTTTIDYDDLAGHDWTGYTNGEKTVSASTEFATLVAYKALDGGIGSGQYWITNTSVTGWLKIDFGAGNRVKVDNFDLVMNTIPEPNRAPKDFMLQGSNDDTEWDTLATITSETGWSSGESRNFAASVKDWYRYIRVNITDNNGDANYTQIGELYLWGESAPNTTTTTTTQEVYSTNFSEYTPDVEPSDWTEQWEPPAAAFTAKDDGGQYGAQYALINHSTYGPYITEWDDVPTTINGEALAKIRFGDSFPVAGHDYFRVTMRRTDVHTNKNAYEVRLYPDDDEIKIYKWVDNVESQRGPTASKAIGTGWYWVRFYVRGDVLKVKVWAGQPSDEPVSWDISTTDTDHTGISGKIGIGSYDGTDTRVDWFSVGINVGAPAPPDYLTTTTTTTTSTSTTTTGTTETPMEPPWYTAVGTVQGG